MISLEHILNEFKKHRPLADTRLIEKAYYFAQSAHRGQKRLSGADKIEHLTQTAYTLAQLRLDAPTIAGGLLHDIIEDTLITPKEIEKTFGREVSFLVEGITRLDKIQQQYKTEDKKEAYIENIRKLFLAMAKDIRVVLIKLADRLHNMKTLWALPKEKQKQIALNTLEIFAPLAYRLGIRGISGQLEDLAFAYAYPQEYNSLVERVKTQYEEGKKYLQKIKVLVEKILTDKGIRVIEIHSRTKRYYSLYRKLLRYQGDWHRIYDLVALRIIVPDIESCYATLGLIHKKWKPLIGRIKDYIAIPKPNHYRSLHTTVFCQGGKITEFQIRTPQMHQEAEYGIAAHWLYREEKKRIKDFFKDKGKRVLRLAGLSRLEKEIGWAKQLQEWRKETFESPEEFLESLKIDFLKNRIFVFTPKGDIIDLPEGATPLDFAYYVHTEIGHRCAGAKVDGRLKALNEPLENGQLVEVITKKNKRPSSDWLRIAKTHHAQSQIRNWLKKNQGQN